MTLKIPFDDSSPSTLENDILEKQITDIEGDYSSDLKLLVSKMLVKVYFFFVI
jgi:hypothetical protein